MSEQADLVLRVDEAGVATLTLNRADKRNALNVDMFRALDTHLAALETQTDSVGVVVLRANGPVFSAGADLGKQQKPPVRHFQSKTIQRLADLPQPVVAAVHAPCFTGGLELVLAADIIMACESARFADTHAKWALVPGWGMTQRLPRRVGQAKAREMMFTAREYSAQEAQAMGLINLCVADDMFEAEVERLARDIANLSWHSHRGNKALLSATSDLPLEAGLAHEVFASPGVGPDFAERVGGKFGGQ